MDERLPQDILEAILAKLDRQTLCTARLVSRPFCAAASAHTTSLTLGSPSHTMSLERFPRLGHVRLHDSVKGCNPAQLDPRLRAVITHLTVSQRKGRASMALRELPGMPKLRELVVNVEHNIRADMRVEVPGDVHEVLHRLTNLEALRIGDCTPSVARTITMTTWLTSLCVGLVGGGPTDDEGWEPADCSWLQHATNLRNLQALEIAVYPEGLQSIGNLTGLTGLTWLGYPCIYGAVEDFSIAPLSRLCRLRSLGISLHISDSNLAIACSLGSGSLAALDLWFSCHASADCGMVLARQTALTHLTAREMRPYGRPLSNLRHMGAVRMELLQSLELVDLNTVDAEGLHVLQKATSLIRLGIGTSVKQPYMGLSQTLGRLTQLRSLQLDFRSHSIDTTDLYLRLALGPLTALTKLRISGRAWTGETGGHCWG